MKKAMIMIDGSLEKACPGALMLLQVHDELVFETEEGTEGKLADFIAQQMGTAYRLAVPLIVDVKAGPNWAEMQEVLLKTK